ncbi:MAG TPA: NADH-quinone oxidoreductase subunit K [Candidatus Paceibacterota bacterium]
MTSELIALLPAFVFMTIVIIHLAKKSGLVVWLFTLQSAAIVILLAQSAISHLSIPLIATVIAIAIVKLIVAPYFLSRLIKTHTLRFSSNTYLSGPVTLIVLTLIIALSSSYLFKPLAVIAPGSSTVLFLSIASLFSALFLVINRQGALSQMIGILSMENSIMLLALTAGLEQSPSLELGVTFDLFIWICVAYIFLSLMYRQFGTLDVTQMRKLKD